MKRKVTRRKPLKGSVNNLPDWSQYRSPTLPPCSNGFGNSDTSSKSMFAALHKEPEHVRVEITRKSKQVAPVCNKGAYMYIGEFDDVTAIGRKK